MTLGYPQQIGRARPQHGSPLTNGIHLVPAANIQPESITWLLDGWLAAGKFHLLAGPPSTGKTTIATAIMASISNGSTGRSGWPGNSPITGGEVIFWSCEDGIEDTVVPRLMAAGADLTRIHIVRGTIVNGQVRPFGAQDIPRLSQAIARIGPVRLVVIDPIVQVVAGDSNKNAVVRSALAPLIELAETHGCALLGITHVNKSSKGKEPLDRINGSVAYGAVARVAMMTARVEGGDPTGGPGASVIVRAKSNIGPTDGGLKYRIEPVTFLADGKTINTSRIDWSATPLMGSAKEILKNAETGGPGESSSAVEQAALFLEEFLANGGRSYPDVVQSAQSAGISVGTLKRAKQILGITSKKQTGMGQSSPFFWFLPERPIQQMMQPGFVNQNIMHARANPTGLATMGYPLPQHNLFQNGMPFHQSMGPLANFPNQLQMPVAAPSLEGVLGAQSTAAPAPLEPLEPPLLPVESDSVEPEVRIKKDLLAWMVDLCKLQLSEHQGDPNICGDDRFDAFDDRVASIANEVLDVGLSGSSDEEFERNEPLYRKALHDTNWWAGHSC